MARRIGVLVFVLGLGLAASGCGGYGDEVEDTGGTGPPLAMMQEVNDWLRDYQKQHGSVPETYEQLKTAYEATGKTWPPFPPGGTWAYFPRRARVVDVREDWVKAYLRHQSRTVAEAKQHFYNLERADGYLRREFGISAICPGYKIVFEIRGSQSYFETAYEADGLTPARGNHTATEYFDIDNEGRMRAVPRSAT